MIRRHLVHVLLFTLLVLVTGARVASACARTEWLYDSAELPACVTLVPAGVHDFEVYNDCPDSLTLDASSCPMCTVPGAIPPDDVGVLGLGGEPEQEGDAVEIGWDTGGTSGSASFTLPINRCPGGDGCVAAPGTSSSAPWFALLLALGCLWRSRRARR
jgi:subtilisin family serine protease